MSELLIQVEEMSSHVVDPQLVLLDARSREKYELGHIRGAVSLPPRLLEEAPILDNGSKVPHVVMRPSHAMDVLRRAGLRNTSRVVVYDDGGGYLASRLWWMLAYYGHAATTVLDGGFHAWQAAGLPASADVPEPEKGDFFPHAEASTAADFYDVLLCIGRQSPVLVNTLSVESFEAGAIPDSVSFPFQLTYRDGRVRPSGVLRALFEERGMSSDRELVFYCGVGYTASQGLFAARVAGFERVRLYDGSLKDWVARGGGLSPRGVYVRS